MLAAVMRRGLGFLFMIDVIAVCGNRDEVDKKNDIVGRMQFIHVWNGKVRLVKKFPAERPERRDRLCGKLLKLEHNLRAYQNFKVEGRYLATRSS